MLSKLKKTLFGKGNIITFELDDWYTWYKEPKKFHQAVVTHLKNEGRLVETISIAETVNSQKISTLSIDGIKYELSVRNYLGLGPTQSVYLEKVE